MRLQTLGASTSAHDSGEGDTKDDLAPPTTHSLLPPPGTSWAHAAAIWIPLAHTAVVAVLRELDALQDAVTRRAQDCDVSVLLRGPVGVMNAVAALSTCGDATVALQRAEQLITSALGGQGDGSSVVPVASTTATASPAPTATKAAKGAGVQHRQTARTVLVDVACTLVSHCCEASSVVADVGGGPSDPLALLRDVPWACARVALCTPHLLHRVRVQAPMEDGVDPVSSSLSISEVHRLAGAWGLLACAHRCPATLLDDARATTGVSTSQGGHGASESEEAAPSTSLLPLRAWCLALQTVLRSTVRRNHIGLGSTSCCLRARSARTSPLPRHASFLPWNGSHMHMRVRATKTTAPLPLLPHVRP